MTTRCQFLSLASGAMHVQTDESRAVVMVRWIGDDDWRAVPVATDGSWSVPTERTGTLEVMSYAVNQPAIAEPDMGIPISPRQPRTNPNDAWRGKRYG